MATENLVEYAKTFPDDSPERAFIEIFAEESDFLRVMPWANAPGGTYRYNRESAMPGVAFRGINESYTPTTGIINPQIEQTFIAGGQIKVDNALIRRHGASRRVREERMQSKAMTRAISSKILFGNNSANPREFDGLYRRLTGGNVKHNTTAAGGAALSMYLLDRAIDACVEPTHIIANKAFRTRLLQAGKNTGVTGFVAQTKEDIGGMITSYRGLPILVGYENDVDGLLIDFNESPFGGGTANNMSVFVVSLKDGHMTGLEVAPMEVKDLGQIPGQPHLLTEIEWDIGMALEHPLCAIRLDSIADAPFTA